eukprot:237853-Hanusia_phi.AAC.1
MGAPVDVRLLVLAFASLFDGSTGQYLSATPSCSGVTVLSGTIGSIGLGYPYDNDLQCGWIIQPEKAISIDLT